MYLVSKWARFTLHWRKVENFLLLLLMLVVYYLCTLFFWTEQDWSGLVRCNSRFALGFCQSFVEKSNLTRRVTAEQRLLPTTMESLLTIDYYHDLLSCEIDFYDETRSSLVRVSFAVFERKILKKRKNCRKSSLLKSPLLFRSVLGQNDDTSFSSWKLLCATLFAFRVDGNSKPLAIFTLLLAEINRAKLFLYNLQLKLASYCYQKHSCC